MRVAQSQFGPRSLACLVIVVATVAGLLPDNGLAHLALIREGLESSGVPETDDYFGYAVAAGDFNGDGFDDLAIGIPQDDNSGAQDGQHHGNVVISYGSALGITPAGAQQLSFTADLSDDDVRFGHALAAGDFDDDGYDDLAVGLVNRDVGTATNAGEVWIFEGSIGGIDPTPIVFTQADCGGLSESNDQFGFSLATGDFDGNFADDLAIGAPGEDNLEGAVFYIMSFAPVGLEPAFAGAGFFKQTDLGQQGNAGERFGYALATGQVLGGSDIDLAVGAPYDFQSDPEPEPTTGRATIIAGSGTGLTSAGSVNFNAVELGLVATLEPRFGFSLASGRIAAAPGVDGIIDLAVGEPGFLGDVGRAVIWRSGSATLTADLGSIPAGTAAAGTGDYLGWSLAAGDLDDDGYDELAAGCPLRDNVSGAVTVQNTGLVAVFSYDGITFPSNKSTSLDPQWLFDIYRPTGLGFALTFGRFDQTAFGAFAAGAPFADYTKWVDLEIQPTIVGAGQVHIYAPHRQVFDLRSRSATLTDCNDNLVFSQRPYDEVVLSSTTKIMTDWIAAEHITNAIGGIDSSAIYVVPRWISDCVGGSSADIIENERVSLINLMKMLMSVSGNDAAWAIGDMLTGESWPWPAGDCTKSAAEIPAFTDSMNTRASDIGMTQTTFENPAGLDWPLEGPTPRSTAYDFSLLSRRAMRNEVFRYTVYNEKWWLDRVVVEQGGGYAWDQLYDNSWVRGMRTRMSSRVPAAEVTGVKPGGTPKGNATGVAMARLAGQLETIATIFGTEEGAESDGKRRNDKLADLLQLGLNLCVGSPPGLGGDPLPPEPDIDVPGISTGDQDTTGVSPGAVDVGGGTMLVEIYPDSVPNPDADFTLCVKRSLAYILDAGSSITLTVGPFQSQEGILLSNDGVNPISIDINHNQPGTTYSLILGAQADSMIVGSTSVPVGTFLLMITNTSTTATDTISLEERGFKFTTSVGSEQHLPFTVSMTSSGEPIVQAATVQIEGQDTTPGNTVRMIIRADGVPTAVQPPSGGPFIPGAARLITETAAYPNPFNPSTRIEFFLNAQAEVSLAIYDVRGRRVRLLENPHVRPAGVHIIPWDGRDESGRPVASGVYFYRVDAGFDVRTARLVLVR